MGTPQSLDELTLQIMMVPMNQFRERVPQMIRDYLSQGYGACMMKYPEHADALEECFNHLCRRNKAEGEKS